MTQAEGWGVKDQWVLVAGDHKPKSHPCGIDRLDSTGGGALPLGCRTLPLFTYPVCKGVIYLPPQARFNKSVSSLEPCPAWDPHVATVHCVLRQHGLWEEGRGYKRQ